MEHLRHCWRYRRSRLVWGVKRGAAWGLGMVLQWRALIQAWRGQARSLAGAPTVVVVIDRCLGVGDLLMISPGLRLLAENRPVRVIAPYPALVEGPLTWQQTASWAEHRAALGQAIAEGAAVLVPFSGLRGLLTLALWPGRLPPGVVVLDSQRWLDTSSGRSGPIHGHHYSDGPVSAARALRALIEGGAAGGEPAADGAKKPPSLPRPARLPPRQDPAAAALARPAGPYLVLAPWAGAATRRWPLGHWARLIRLVAEARAAAGAPLAFILVGSAEEVPQGETLARLVGPSVTVVNRMGQLSLAGTAALIAGARALLCGDNGPMHLGIGVGVPVLALFGSTDPSARLDGPLAQAIADPGLCPQRRAPCYPGYLRDPPCPSATECLTLLAPERVAALVLSHLDHAPDHAPAPRCP